MQAVMPRFRNCVLCGNSIPRRKSNGRKTRIDCIYCSDSCCTLACNARNGQRWEGRRKPGSTPPPGEYIPRAALPLVAVRLKAELDAALRRIAELERQLADPKARSNDEEAVKEVEFADGIYVPSLLTEKAPDPDPPAAGAAALESATLNLPESLVDLPSESEWLRIEWAADKNRLAEELAEKERMRAKWAAEQERFATDKEELKRECEQRLQEQEATLTELFDKLDALYERPPCFGDLHARYGAVLSDLQLEEYLGTEDLKQIASLQDDLEAATKKCQRLNGTHEAAQREIGALQKRIQNQERRHEEELEKAGTANTFLREQNKSWARANADLQAEANGQQQRAEKAEEALVRLAASKNHWSRGASGHPTVKARRKGATRKRLPAAARNDKLMAVIKKKVTLQRQLDAARGFKPVGKSKNIQTVARQLAKEARQRFIASWRDAVWVAPDRLLDRRSEKALHTDQKNQIILLQGQLANAKKQARLHKKAEKAEAARARRQATKSRRSRGASRHPKAKVQRKGAMRKRLPAAAKNDKLMNLMKKKVTLLRQRNEAKGIAQAGKRPNLLTVARQKAKNLRHWFIGTFLGAAGVAVAWVVRDRLLDAQSEKRLYEEQKKNVQQLQREVAPLLRQTRRKAA